MVKLYVSSFVWDKNQDCEFELRLHRSGSHQPEKKRNRMWHSRKNGSDPRDKSDTNPTSKKNRFRLLILPTKKKIWSATLIKTRVTRLTSSHQHFLWKRSRGRKVRIEAQLHIPFVQLTELRNTQTNVIFYLYAKWKFKKGTQNLLEELKLWYK